MFRYNQTPSGSFIGGAAQPVRLREAVKHSLLFFLRNTDFGIAYGKEEIKAVVGFFISQVRTGGYCIAVHFYDDFALLGKLDRIFQKIVQQLTQPVGIAIDFCGNLIAKGNRKLQTLLLGSGKKHSGGFAHEGQKKSKRVFFHLDGFRLQRRDGKNVVDRGH